MRRRHPALPTRWLLTDERMGDALWDALRRLPPGSGVIVRHYGFPSQDRAALLRRVRRLGAARGLVVWDDKCARVARVHSGRELRRALLRSPRLLFLSPLFPTRTHPDWPALPWMRAAALRRLSPRPVLALGGMNEKRFRRAKTLGFGGYGAIDGWLD